VINCDKDKPAGIRIEYHFPKALITGVYFGCLARLTGMKTGNREPSVIPTKQKKLHIKPLSKDLQTSHEVPARNVQHQEQFPTYL
jgi:hypothetical protein